MYRVVLNVNFSVLLLVICSCKQVNKYKYEFSSGINFNLVTFSG